MCETRELEYIYMTQDRRQILARGRRNLLLQEQVSQCKHSNTVYFKQCVSKMSEAIQAVREMAKFKIVCHNLFDVETRADFL